MKILLGLMLCFVLHGWANAAESKSFVPKDYRLVDFEISDDPTILLYTMVGTGERTGCVVRMDILYSYGWDKRGPLPIRNKWWVRGETGDIISAEQIFPTFMWWDESALPMAFGDFETLTRRCGFVSAGG